MLEISNDLTITISYGDVLDAVFNIRGVKIEQNAEFYLAIRKELTEDCECYIEQVSEIDYGNNAVRIKINSTEMEKFPVGKYYYDLLYKTPDGNRRTLNYPARLIVKEVVHNVPG